MAIDPRIILQAGQGVTPLMSQAEIQDQQAQRQLSNYKLNALRQSAEDDAAYRNVLRSSTPDQLPNKLYAAGLGTQAQAAQKFQQEQERGRADQRKTQVETGSKMMEAMGTPLKYLADNPTMETAEKVFQHLSTNGIMTPEHIASAKQQLAQNPTPEGIRQFAMLGYQSAINAEKQLASDTQRRGQDITMRGQDLTQGTTLRGQDLTRDTALQGQGITRRGQDMTDARSREANASGRVPSGYRQTADGTLEFIPGGPADPSAAKKAAPTEFQGKNAIFGGRATEADRILTELGSEFSPAAINTKTALGNTPMIGGALEAGANMAMSKNSQKAEQAQRDFINAVLRLESGAAIGKDEFDNAKKQYFPQPGDSAEVITQKAANRKIQIQGLLNNAGGAQVPKPQSAPMKVSNAADYAKVPSGSQYVAPDGSTRTKK